MIARLDSDEVVRAIGNLDLELDGHFTIALVVARLLVVLESDK